MRICNKIFILFLGILICFITTDCWARKITADDVGKVYLKIVNNSGVNLTDVKFFYNNRSYAKH